MGEFEPRINPEQIPGMDKDKKIEGSGKGDAEKVEKKDKSQDEAISELFTIPSNYQSPEDMFADELKEKEAADDDAEERQVEEGGK